MLLTLQEVVAMSSAPRLCWLPENPLLRPTAASLPLGLVFWGLRRLLCVCSGGLILLPRRAGQCGWAGALLPLPCSCSPSLLPARWATLPCACCAHWCPSLRGVIPWSQVLLCHKNPGAARHGCSLTHDSQYYVVKYQTHEPGSAFGCTRKNPK